MVSSAAAAVKTNQEFHEYLRALGVRDTTLELDLEDSIRAVEVVRDSSHLVRLARQPCQFAGWAPLALVAAAGAARLTATSRPLILLALYLDLPAATAMNIQDADPITAARAAMTVERWSPDPPTAIAEVGTCPIQTGLPMDLPITAAGFPFPLSLEPGQTFAIAMAAVATANFIFGFTWIEIP